MSDPLAPASRPDSALRRGFHYRDLVAAGARFRPLDDGTIAADYGVADEAAQAQRLGLADLSPLPRTGFKGPKLAEWMRAQGCALGAESNRTYRIAERALAARLAPSEVVVLGPLDGVGGTVAALEQAWSYDVAGVWPVPRRDASFWFVVTGTLAPTMFAKVCGVDLRPRSFANRQIAQTSVARTNAIVIRDDIDDTPAFHLLGDSASAGFTWEAIVDAMAEFEGKPVGLDALLRIRDGKSAGPV